MMSVLSRLRSPRLTFLMTLLSLGTGIMAVLSPFWVEGCMKKPKPFCTPVKQLRCIKVEDPSNGSSNAQFSWETGDDSFVFPTFHWGLWISCQENIKLDNGEVCRHTMNLTPGSERGILWLSVAMESMYIGLLLLSCLLLLLQLCLSSWCPAAHRWGQLLNAYSALFTVLGGLLGMVAHMMFMQVFQVTISIGPEDFKPHSYGYSWAFYIAWLGFLFCMSTGISTLNNYTKKVIMRGPKHKTTPAVYPCRNFTFPPQPPKSAASAKSALYHSLPPPPAVPPPSPPSPCPCPSPPLSPLSPYYTTSSGDVLTVVLPVHQQRELELQMHHVGPGLHHAVLRGGLQPPLTAQEKTPATSHIREAIRGAIMSGQCYAIAYSEEEYSLDPLTFTTTAPYSQLSSLLTTQLPPAWTAYNAVQKAIAAAKGNTAQTFRPTTSLLQPIYPYS
ncbi:germ cell-specific gene 1 protein-like [Engraulis encrasicolus]|uniref:germ cell-specific gene 1 protein-like n=1 Tax=Engraulis encrasicolus TaxID=184585 RepID=UPI002FD0BC68